MLKTTYEDPISYAFSKDKKHLKEFIKTNVKLIFNWLILIHLKTFLWDKKFKYDFKKDQKIGDYYDWEILHHLHCIARTCYTNIPIDSNVFWSFLVLPALQWKDISNFDFLNIYLGCTVLIRLGDVAIIIVGNDSSITLNSHLDLINKISSPLNPVQLRELATRFAYTNIMLKERPNYYTHKNAFSNQMEIKAKVPEYYEIEKDPLIFGKMFYHYIQDIFKETRKTKKISEIISHIKKGKYSYLINEKGEFIKNM